MKKYYPYITGGAVLLVLILLLMASRTKPARRMDERITLRYQDKIPYGTAVARQLLPSLFPAADIQTDARYPGSWESVNAYASNQAVILVADYFDAENDELERLNRFVRRGNSVFIIARAFSDDAADFFRLTFSSYNDIFTESADSLRLQLVRPFFSLDSQFVYPGKRYESSIRKLDSTQVTVLGRNGGGWANFVGMKRGNGTFYLHTAPLAFSNYFILHKQNVAYYQHALSVVPKQVKAVLWNDYFLQKPQSRREEKDVNWLGALFSQPAFRWGFLTAMATLLLYMLLGMRRKQRLIPPHDKPRNDSLDFVKTLGRLYYEKRDHKNLAEKMGAYFLEHVRSTYKIATHTLDDDFVVLLHVKSGYPQPEIKNIVHEIRRLPDGPNLTEEELARFHKSLELFYQNT